MVLNDLTILTLDLLEEREIVPETRTSHNGVRGEDLHTVDLGRRVLLRGLVAPDDLILLEHLREREREKKESI